MGVHSFPPSRFIQDRDFPVQNVLIAPDPVERGVWIAWGCGQRGPVILERADRDHVVSDAYTFAGRLKLDVTELRVPYVTGPRHTLIPNGTMHISPSMTDGGSWDVMHESRSGDSWSAVTNFFSYDDALAFARAEAARIGAEVADDLPPEPQDLGEFYYGSEHDHRPQADFPDEGGAP